MKKILSSNHLQKLLEHKYDILTQFKKIHYDEFCKYLLKVKTLDEVNAYKVNGISNHLNRLAIFHHRPIDEIVYKYQKKYFKGFDQDILAMNIKTLGGIFESFEKDGMLYSGNERSKEMLFFEERFNNVMNDVRYACQENTYVSNRNLCHIVKGLGKMGYIEREMLELLIEKLSYVAGGNEKSEIDTSKVYYQMNRNYYYAQGEMIDRTKLLKSESFNKILEEILNNPDIKTNSTNRSGTNNSSTPQTSKQTQFQYQEQQDSHKIQELISSINSELDKTSKNLSQFVQSIISLRLKYIDMVKATSNKYIISDPNLNTQLLELQQLLLQFKLIKLQELKNHQIITNRQQFLKNSKEIIYDFLNNPQENMKKYIDVVLDKYNTIKVNNVKVPSNINNEVVYFGKLVQEISEYLNSQNKEIRRDGLVQSKWKTRILDNSQVLLDTRPNNVYAGHSYKLNTDRGFKDIYQIFVRYLRERGLKEHKEYVMRSTNKLSGICYVKGLIDLGLAEEALQLLRELDIANERLVEQGGSESIYPRQVLIDLISVISTFFSVSSFQNLNNQLITLLQTLASQDKFLETKWKVQDGGYGWGVYQLCTTINYLENTSNTSHPLFNQLVSLLKQQSQSISSLPLHRHHGMIESILSSTEHIPNSNYDTGRFYNPALIAIKEKVLKYLGVLNSQELIGDQYIPYGYVDIERELLNYLVFIPSVFSSNDGKYIDHNLRGHYNRLERVKKMKITPIPFMKLVNYNQATSDYQMKPVPQLNTIISEITENGELSDVSIETIKIMNKIKAQFKSDSTDNLLSNSLRDKKALGKIISTLGEIRDYISRGKKIQNINISYINRYKIVYLLIRLNKEIGYLTQKVKTQLNLELTKQSIQKLIGKLSSINYRKQATKETIFSGKRQTIDTIQDTNPNNQQTKPKLDFTNQILDLDFIQNQKYHQYDDWREEIQSYYGVYNSGEISIEDCSPLTKLLLHNKLTLAVPVYKPRKIVSPPYSLSWDKIHRLSKKKELDQSLEVEKLIKQQERWRQDEIEGNNQAQDEIGKKIALQNLKHQIKFEKSKEQIVSLLNSFEFIDDLISEHLQLFSPDSPAPSSQGLLSRDPKCYFQYLSQKPYDHLLSSPYISYVFSKLTKKDKLKSLLLSNKNKSRQLLHKARLNEITPYQYNQQCQALHKISMRELDAYRTEMLDEQFVIMRDSTRLIIKPSVNEEELGRLLMLQLNPYNVEDDIDVIFGEGEFEEALGRKRYKEEQKLIKLRILGKITRKEKLNENEQKYLKLWTEEAVDEEKLERFSFTNRTVKDLSDKDKKIFESFHHSKDLPTKYPSLRLTDVILELGHCFSNSLIKSFESKILLKRCEQKYLQQQTPNTSFTSSFSSALDINQNLIISNYLLELQRIKFDEESKLNKQDLNNIVEISKYMKTEDPRVKHQYKFVYEGIEEELSELNKLPNRNVSITEWYRIKEQEFDHAFKISSEGQAKKQQQLLTIWNQLTGKSPDSTTRHELSELVHTICERLFVFRKSCPPYLSNLIAKILMHPQLSYPDRCVLLGSIELVKFPLTIDSEDIVKLARVGAGELRTVEEVKSKIQEAQRRYEQEQKVLADV